MISELLSALGAHFYLIMIGCIELVVAVFLLGSLPKRRKKDRQSAASGTGTEQLIQTLSQQEEEVFLILRCSDLLPLYAAGDMRGMLGVRVHDTSIGMNPEFIGRIFRPFEQEDASTTRCFGGTGLGMAISDQLVKLMGGQIVVESSPGKSSDFSVFLSLPVADKNQIPEEKESEPLAPVGDTRAALRPCRILMAEDNEINAMIAVEILTQKGANVEVAENGQKAVDMFAPQKMDYYDLILMDIQMPVMDGRTAARAIRAMRRPDAAAVPIIYALSADAFVEDERLSRESGMNGHLTKPIDFDALWNVIYWTEEQFGEDNLVARSLISGNMYRVAMFARSIGSSPAKPIR